MEENNICREDVLFGQVITRSNPTKTICDFCIHNHFSYRKHLDIKLKRPHQKQKLTYIRHIVSRTVRCKLPNVNQETGGREPRPPPVGFFADPSIATEKHIQEPDQTLRSYRKIDAGSPSNACLGMQLVAADEFSTLRVGDKLVVHETGDHLYIPLFS